MGVRVEDIKHEIKEYNLRVLIGDNESIIERALEKAKLWVEALVKKATGSSPNWDDPVIELAVIKYALYELYSYAEVEEIARDKKEDALLLLKALYGDMIEKIDKEAQQFPPVVHVKAGKEEWRGYR